MLSQSSRVFLRIAGLAFLLALAYSVTTGNRDGTLLFLGLTIVAVYAGVSVTVVRENEFAPAPPLDTPPPQLHPVSWARPVAGGLWPATGAVALALVLCGFVVGPVAVVAGLVLGAATVVGWMTAISGDHTGRDPNLVALGLPVVGLFAIFCLMFFLSRVLLAVPEQAATITALVVAVTILSAGTLVTLRPGLDKRSLITILAAAGVLLASGGLGAAAIGPRRIEKPEGVAGEPVKVEAQGIQFVTKEITVKAAVPAQINFANRDGSSTPHNVAVYADPEHTKGVFIGDVIPGGTKIAYHFRAPEAGTYFFRCDVHPGMQGKLIVRS